ncbi:DUF2846 domain-containing protein [Thiomicrorhabdus sp. Kp2]|uniref:DUF2846 domain-containing protein n=1 Tax=Thiomicrorhabdus sp. Kp2 TaxID=1123518 RepID=UPI000415AAC9|nr:DUF2846 domain-containing protein [Thiomicrorhabdus sp. Kp2]
MKTYLILPLILSVIFLTACNTVPIASDDADSLAKNFKPNATKSKIYVYQTEPFSSITGVPIALDKKIAGEVTANSFYVWTVEPGRHVISSLTANKNNMWIDTEAGQNYYVKQTVNISIWKPTSLLEQVSEKEGIKAINQSKLIDVK